MGALAAAVGPAVLGRLWLASRDKTAEVEVVAEAVVV